MCVLRGSSSRLLLRSGRDRTVSDDVAGDGPGFFDFYQAAVEEILMSHSMQKGAIRQSDRADMAYLECPNGNAIFLVGSIAWFGSLSVKGSTYTESTVIRIVL
jgi:hypothetical protein